MAEDGTYERSIENTSSGEIIGEDLKSPLPIPWGRGYCLTCKPRTPLRSLCARACLSEIRRSAGKRDDHENSRGLATGSRTRQCENDTSLGVCLFMANLVVAKTSTQPTRGLSEALKWPRAIFISSRATSDGSFLLVGAGVKKNGTWHVCSDRCGA